MMSMTADSSSPLVWDDDEQSKPSSHLTLGDILTSHLSLSHQLSQALFTSLQSSHSTTLPPDPIPRPPRLPRELDSLPLWNLPPTASPTPREIIPSLAIVHVSLDEYLLKARTYQANAARIQELRLEIASLQKRRRERIRLLDATARDLKEVVFQGREEVKKIKRARQEPLDYHRVLAYAADLARTTSAPPGYSEAKLLRQGVEAALKQTSADQASPTQQQQHQHQQQLQEQQAIVDSVNVDTVSGGQGEETLPTIPLEAGTTSSTKKEEEEEEEGEKADQTTLPAIAASSKDLPNPVTSASTRGATSNEPPTTGVPRSNAQPRYLHPEEEGEEDPAQPVDHPPHPHPHPAFSTTPQQLLPFPTDADIRRGLMGMAMLDESAAVAVAVAVAGMASILPPWGVFKVQWEKEQRLLNGMGMGGDGGGDGDVGNENLLLEDGAMNTKQKQDKDKQDQQEKKQKQKTMMMFMKRDEPDEDLGLDLN